MHTCLVSLLLSIVRIVPCGPAVMVVLTATSAATGHLGHGGSRRGCGWWYIVSKIAFYGSSLAFKTMVFNVNGYVLSSIFPASIATTGRLAMMAGGGALLLYV